MGAVAQNREGLLGERRDDELAFLARFHGLLRHGIDDLEQQVVLGDVQPAGALALARDTGAHHLGKAVVVGGADVQLRLDLGLHLLRARLTAEQAEPQRECLEVDARLLP